MKKGLLVIPILLFLLPLVTGLVLATLYFRKLQVPVEIRLLKVQSQNLVKSPIDQYYASAQSKVNVLAAVGRSDGRPVIVDNFLARHKSPRSGMGYVFVAAADQYGIDYRLLPAIAFQESTLGKYMPKGSHNAWGWAIYTGEASGARFKNWEQAIYTVAEGLKSDYIDRGLQTTEAIMTRYTDSEGTWAFGVNFAIAQMSP